MIQTIRIWNAFSPNNSSDFRLVARFADPRAARETAVELVRFLLDHTREVRRRWVDSPPADELAARYGFAWTSLLEWSTQIGPGDEPEVAIEDEVLVVYHPYCLGFGDLPVYLQAKGAIVEEEQTQPPTLSALFRSIRGDNPALDTAIAALIERIYERPDRKQWFRAPWHARDRWNHRAAGFRDAGVVGLWFPVTPQDLPAFRRWLDAHGIEDPVLRWCEHADEALFVTIANARCGSCGGPLDYLDPRLHDIDTPQLVCRPCGGLYELATFLPEAP